MGKVHNLNKLKKAKIFKEDLKFILNVINLAHRALSKYNRYKIVAEIVSVLQSNELILKNHLKKIDQIIENKGLEDNVPKQ